MSSLLIYTVYDRINITRIFVVEYKRMLKQQRVEHRWAWLLNAAELGAWSMFARVWKYIINDNRILLEAGANPNVPDPVGQTAIFYAARVASIECLKLLVEVLLTTIIIIIVANRDNFIR